MSYRQQDYYYPGRSGSRRPVARPCVQTTEPIQRYHRSSQEQRLSDARNLFLADETAKPILRSPYEEVHPTSKALYFGTLQNKEFSQIFSPDQAEFLAEQEELDRRNKQRWGAAIKHRVTPNSFRAGYYLLENAFNYPRVQKHGHKLRLLERKPVLDSLTPPERHELVEWWVSRFNQSIESPPTTPMEDQRNLFTRTLAHVAGTKYWKARRTRRKAQARKAEKERNMTATQRTNELYGGNPNGRLNYLRPRTASGSQML